MLKVNNIEVVYNGVILVLRGVTLEVGTGQIVALLGARSARASRRRSRPSLACSTQQGEVTRSNVDFDGERVDRMYPEDIVQRGVVQVHEDRPLPEHLTVDENLRAGRSFAARPAGPA